VSEQRTWILTGSLENFRATRERDFRLIGAKERRRRLAEQIEPGHEIVFYVTGVQAFGGIVRVTSEMFEDRAKVWPGKPENADPYPWRFETEHVRKWPADHWQLAFQGQLRTVSDADARLLRERIGAVAGTPA
jgi:EVE domain-containing protein